MIFLFPVSLLLLGAFICVDVFDMLGQMSKPFILINLEVAHGAADCIFS